MENSTARKARVEREAELAQEATAAPWLPEHDRQHLDEWLPNPPKHVDPHAATRSPNDPFIIHAVMYRNYKIGTLCDSLAWGAPDRWTTVTDEVSCPACRTKIDGTPAHAPTGVAGGLACEWCHGYPTPCANHRPPGPTPEERILAAVSEHEADVKTLIEVLKAGLTGNPETTAWEDLAVAVLTSDWLGDYTTREAAR